MAEKAKRFQRQHGALRLSTSSVSSSRPRFWLFQKGPGPGITKLRDRLGEYFPRVFKFSEIALDTLIMCAVCFSFRTERQPYWKSLAPFSHCTSVPFSSWHVKPIVRIEPTQLLGKGHRQDHYLRRVLAIPNSDDYIGN